MCNIQPYNTHWICVIQWTRVIQRKLLIWYSAALSLSVLVFVLTNFHQRIHACGSLYIMQTFALFFFVFVPEHWIWQRIALFEVLICWRFLIYVLLSPSTFKAYADTDNHRVVEKNWSILPRNAFVNIKTIKEWKSRRTGHKQIQKFNNVECLV